MMYVVRCQWHDGDSGTEAVYGPFRSRDRAVAFGDRIETRAEEVLGEDAMLRNPLRVDVLAADAPRLRDVYQAYGIEK